MSTATRLAPLFAVSVVLIMSPREAAAAKYFDEISGRAIGQYLSIQKITSVSTPIVFNHPTASGDTGSSPATSAPVTQIINTPAFQFSTTVPISGGTLTESYSYGASKETFTADPTTWNTVDSVVTDSASITVTEKVGNITTTLMDLTSGPISSGLSMTFTTAPLITRTADEIDNLSISGGITNGNNISNKTYVLGSTFPTFLYNDSRVDLDFEGLRAGCCTGLGLWPPNKTTLFGGADNILLYFFVSDANEVYPGLAIGNEEVLNYSAMRLPGAPEPATWATMLIGFAAVGALLRASNRRSLLSA